MPSTKQPSLNKTLLYLIYRSGKYVIDLMTITQDISRWHKAMLQGGYEYVKLSKRLLEKRTVRATINNLKHQKYIQTKKIGHRLVSILSNKGRRIALRESIRHAPLLPNYMYTVIIFDIPETQRSARRQLRLFLKSSDFKKLQLSVWISPRDVFKLLSQLIKQLKIESWANVFQAKNFLRPPTKN